MNNREFIQNHLSEFNNIADSISIVNIDKAVDILFQAWQNGNQIFTCGNGGSASTATHFACDLTKTTIVDGKERLNVYCLNDNIPLMSALINDEGFGCLFYEQLKPKLSRGDVLISISVHGGDGRDRAGPWSQNLLQAIQYVCGSGGKTIGLTGFSGGPMQEIADVCIVVPANSTPHVESFHLVLAHLICSCLKKKIEAS